MKHTAKRTFSLLLALILCLQLLPALTLETEAASYVYNWGSRGTTATSLSDAAKSFYSNNGVSYEDWADLDGGTATTAYQSELYKSLQSLMRSNHKTITSYADTRDLYQYTDCQNGGGKISSFYSGDSIGPAWDGGSTWNREHTWPNSKGLDGSDENDIMMLRPTSTKENSDRSNTAYGEASGYYDPNKVSGGSYDLRGDVARIMLYVYVRWGNTNIWGSGGVLQSLDVALKWIEADPVDTWELGRNDSVQSITGTRNVFVDYPELAFLMFDRAVPGTMVTPSGKAAENTYSITAVPNDPAWGSVEVSGKNINCTPAQGYRVKDYTVLSGKVNGVEHKGNVLVVDAAGDCTIQVNFEQRERVTLRFLENGSVVDTQDKLADDVITLPGPTGQVPAGYTFRGWLTTTLAETEQAPQGLLARGDSYTLGKTDTDLHAVYSRVDTDSSGTGEIREYELYTGPITEGDYLIVRDGSAMNSTITSNRMQLTAVTAVENTISDPAASIVWHIAPMANGYWSIRNKATGTYLASTGEKNQAKLVSSTTDEKSHWSFEEVSGSYKIINKYNLAHKVNAYLQRNGNYGFATYADDYKDPNLLYKGISQGVLYTTSVHTIEVTVNDPAMGTATLSGGTVIATPNPGYGVQGYSVASGQAVLTPSGNQCAVAPASNCTVLVTFAALPRFSYSFTENGSQTSQGSSYQGGSLTLPGATQVPDGYSFAGWVTAPVSNAEAAPQSTLQAGDAYTLTGNVAFYALYKSVYYTTTVYSITATASDAAMGSVSVEGQWVTATPGEGYMVAGLTAPEGVTYRQEGDRFAIKAEADCQVQVSFQLRPKAELTLSENGTALQPIVEYVGEEFTLPAHRGPVPAGYRFLGWVAEPVTYVSAEPQTVLQPQQKLAVEEGGLRLYALYQDVSYTTTIYSVTAISADAALGTVAVDGQTVTVTPAQGYQIKDWVCADGAVITRDQNILTVVPAANTTLTVRFEERTTVTALITENGKTVLEKELYPGETVTVPAFSGELLKGYTFVGWVSGAYTASAAPQKVYKSGDQVTLEADLDLRALYKAGKYTTDMTEIPTVILLDAKEVGDATAAWVNGREYPVQVVGGVPQVTFAKGVDPTDLVIYSWHIGDEADVHTHYPTGMKLWTVALTDGAYVATRQAELDDLLTYAGCSIRITGKKGIRMITSVSKAQKQALTSKSGLAGYTLVEYGTLLGYASKFTQEAPLTLSHPDAKHNYAYKKGVADPIFKQTNTVVQYTNVLVGFNNDQCKEDIAMRPYMILQDAKGKQITVYGGVIYRSIGYIAYQNRMAFTTGSAAYQYVWDIIHHVYGNAYDADYKK